VIRCGIGSAVFLAGVLLFGAGCGPEQAADPTVAAPVVEAAAASDPALPAPGTARVEFANGRVSVFSNGAQRLAILEQLAEKAGFELLVGDVERLALTLRIEDTPLGEALTTLLAGVPYRLEYDHDAAAGLHVLVWLTVGYPVSAGAAAQPEPEDEEPQFESAQEVFWRYGENLRERLLAMSPEERQRMREEHAAWAEAMEPELLEQLEDPDPEVRSDAIADLPIEGEGAIGAERFQRIASLLADDPDRRVRIAAVERLGELESPEAINALAKTLSDPDHEVVLAAIEALEDVDDASAIPYLEPLLQDPDTEIRDAAEFAIEYLRW
jgi:hypothetical protein